MRSLVVSLAVAILATSPAAAPGQEVTGATPSSASLTPGAAVTVTLSGRGLELATGAQVLSAGRPVSSVTGRIVRKGTTSILVELAAAKDAGAGDYALALLGSSKSIPTPVRIAVAVPTTRITSASPNGVSVEAGGAAAVRLQGIALEGLASPVVQRAGATAPEMTARFTSGGSTQRDVAVEASACATPATDYELVVSTARGPAKVPIQLAVVPPATPPALVSLALAPTSLEGGNGNTTQGTVQLDKPAPAAGALVTLTKSGIDPDVIVLPLGDVTVGPCEASSSFTIATRTVPSPRSVLVTATLAGGGSRTATVELRPPVPLLESFTLSRDRLWGGGEILGTITLNRFSPLDTAVQITQIGLDTPRGVLVRANQRSVAFQYVVPPVSDPTLATVTASLNGSTRDVTMTLDPTVELEFGDLTIEGTHAGLPVDRPRTVNATLTLDHPAPPGGLRTVLTFMKADGTAGTSRLRNPSGQAPFVPEGQTSVTFPVDVLPGKDPEDATVIVEVRPSVSGPGAISSSANAFLNLAAMPHRFTGLTLDRTSIPGQGVVTATVTLEFPPAFDGQRIHLAVGRGPDGTQSLPPDQASRFSNNTPNTVFTIPSGQTSLAIPVTVQAGSQPAFPAKFVASFATVDGVGLITSQELLIEPSP